MGKPLTQKNQAMIIKILLVHFVLQLLKVLKTNKNMKITSPQLRRPPNKTAQTLKRQENAPLRQKHNNT
jgi:hypothetical protein